MSRARPSSAAPPPEPPRSSVLSETDAWRVADGVLFSVLSSLVLWSIILTSLYRALT